MKNTDYINSVTKGISNKRAKAAVSAELTDHLEINKKIIEEIGYDSDTSEEKAVECMGETEAVAEQLADIHKSCKNEAIKNVLIIVFAVVLNTLIISLNNPSPLSEIYYPMILMHIALVYTLMLFASFTGLKRKSISISAATIALTLFDCFAFSNSALGLFEYVGGTANGFMRFLFDIHPLAESMDKTYLYTSPKLFAAVLAKASPIIIINIFTIIYSIRVKRLKNNKRDLKVNKIFKAASSVFLCASLLITGLSFYRYAVNITNVRNETEAQFNEAIGIAFELAENLKRGESIEKSIKDSGLTVNEYESNEAFYFFNNFEKLYFCVDYYGGLINIDLIPHSVYNGIVLQIPFSDKNIGEVFNFLKETDEDIIGSSKNDWTGKSKEEILNAFVGAHPYKLQIYFTDESLTYSFFYTNNSFLTGKQVDITFSNNDELISVNHDNSVSVENYP